MISTFDMKASFEYVDWKDVLEFPVFTAFPLALESPELSTTAYHRNLSLFLFFDLSLLLFLLFLYHFLIIFILISSL